MSQGLQITEYKHPLKFLAQDMKYSDNVNTTQKLMWYLSFTSLILVEYMYISQASSACLYHDTSHAKSHNSEQCKSLINCTCIDIQ